MEPNQHIRGFLEYYLRLPVAPNYAVLLSAPWGSGKTFQAKRLVSEIVGDDEFALVSLNGLSSQGDLDNALVAAIHPWTDTKGVRIGAAVGKAILKTMQFELPELSSSDLVSRANKSVYIFDDLERCRLPLKESLGYINQFVERDGCKVLVLANVDEISEKIEFSRTKEKLIGKSLEVRDDFRSAFSHFISTVESPDARSLLEKCVNIIERVYTQSGLRNLRLLQQSMWDYSRLVLELLPTHTSHEAAMENLAGLFFALSFEYRAGRIEAVDLFDRANRALMGPIGENKEPGPMAKANARYAGILIYDKILSDEFLHDFLVLGALNGAQARQSLDGSSWFHSENEPSWQAVWHSFERDDEDTRRAIASLKEDFASRAFLSTGEVLHTFGQMLWLTSIWAGFESLEVAVTECKKYVDDLRSDGKLEPLTADTREDFHFASFAGLGFSQSDTQEFKKIWRYLNDQRALAARDKYPGQANKLLELMSLDPSAFIKQIAFSHDQVAPFARTPILSAIDPKIFAVALAQLPAMDFRQVLLGLSARYDGARLAHELKDEYAWAENVELHLSCIAKDGDPVRRDRISTLLNWTLTKELDRYRAD